MLSEIKTQRQKDALNSCNNAKDNIDKDFEDLSWKDQLLFIKEMKEFLSILEHKLLYEKP